jgi:protein TonB
VRFSVDVDETGRVTGCEIVGSSGVPELDELTCAKISERAVFRPARDAKGNAVAGKWSNTVRWQIPSNKTATAPAPGAFVVNILIERDGTVSSCKVERAEGAAEKTGASLCAGAKTFAPILDSNGEPQRTRVRTSMRIELESVPDE